MRSFAHRAYPHRHRPQGHASRQPISWALMLGLAGAAAAAGPVYSQTLPANARVEFNIPSQPLDAALSRYGDATGREALYDTSLAAGRVSGDVRGVLAPDEALKRLLEGTGLSAQFVAENAFVLRPMPRTSQQGASAQGTQPMSPESRRYYGLIQATLLAALCRSHGARPGHYRLVAMFWIGPDGKVERSQRIGSTGIVSADQQIDATLRNVRLREPPPAGFAQPVLILVVPQAPGVTPGCANVDAGPGPIEVP